MTDRYSLYFQCTLDKIINYWSVLKVSGHARTSMKFYILTTEIFLISYDVMQYKNWNYYSKKNSIETIIYDM